MKVIFSLLLIGFALSSCTPDIKDDFPIKLKTVRGNEHSRVEGTKVFAKIPKDYKFIENLSRYQKRIIYIFSSLNQMLQISIRPVQSSAERKSNQKVRKSIF